MLGKFSGFRKECTVGLLLVSVITIIWLWGFNTNFFFKADALDYAQMGRELADGNGFSTLQIFPRHIPFLSRRGRLHKQNWPNLYRYPLPTVLDAFFYKVTKNISKAAVLQSGTAFLLSIPLFFILATRLTNLGVGIITTLFYAADPRIFGRSYTGMTESLAVFFLLCLFLLAFSRKLPKWKCLAMGIVCALSYLNRTQYIFLVPLVAFYIWITTEKKNRLSGVILLFIGFLITAGPWFIRNMAVAGGPTFSFTTSRNLVFSTSELHSDLEMQLGAPVKALEILKQYGPAIVKKVLRNALSFIHIRFWSNTFSPVAVPLFFLFASFIYRRRSTDKRYDLFRDAIVVSIICNFLIVSLGRHHPGYHLPLQPLVYIVGINEILMLLSNGSFGMLRKLRPVVFCCIFLLGIFKLYNVTMARQDLSRPLTTETVKSYESIKQLTTKNTVVASDISDNICLYAGCRALRLPAFPAELLTINDSYLAIDYVLITKRILEPGKKPEVEPPGGTPHERYTYYKEFIKSKEFLNSFEFIKELPDGSLLFKRLR